MTKLARFESLGFTHASDSTADRHSISREWAENLDASSGGIKREAGGQRRMDVEV